MTCAWSASSSAQDSGPQLAPPRQSLTVPVAGGCKSVATCEEAVRLWCGGYRRADADGDGIPCENVCSTLDQVNAIRQDIGC